MDPPACCLRGQLSRIPRMPHEQVGRRVVSFRQSLLSTYRPTSCRISDVSGRRAGDAGGGPTPVTVVLPSRRKPSYSLAVSRRALSGGVSHR